MKNPSLYSRAIKKAKKSLCRYKISAIGLNKKGDIIGQTINKSRFSKEGGGYHAEELLIKKYGKKLKNIIICRVNNNGDLLPIDPCKKCQKLADEHDIKIMSLYSRKDMEKEQEDV